MDTLPNPWMPGGVFWKEIQMTSRDGSNYQLSHGYTSQIQTDIDHYPSFLKKMQDFTIDIRCPAVTTIRVNTLYQVASEEPAYSYLIDVVRCFTSFIMDKNMIQILLIRLDLGADLNVQDVASILSPLQRLYGIPEVTIVLKNGEAPLPILRLLKDVIQDPTPVHNVLKQFTLLAHKLACTPEPIRFISYLQQLYRAFNFQDRAHHFLIIKKEQGTDYGEEDYDEEDFHDHFLIIKKEQGTDYGEEDYDEEDFHAIRVKAEAILDSLTYAPSSNSVPNQLGNDTFLEKSLSLANKRMILQAKIDSKMDRESLLSSIGLGTESTGKLQ
ncbi:uncharacterized protein K441DRAFT_696105 [Cenococcum geophilum 1.58]|uniref:uncharacterized protein n=1 Tax=Cenococcum geophilum 1.58 TaxID=794803 RepID=UPI00358FA55E|nr:hypothetical protein K441DRAFT_696105 [Cenococcum geophilum 1.58]